MAPLSEIPDNKTFCMAPWVHFHAEPSGKAFPCCISAQKVDSPIGDLNAGQTIEDIWNCEKMRGIRRKMLQGKRLSICTQCYAQEKHGQDSFRLSVNHAFKHHAHRISRTDASGFLKEQTIPYLDIRFSNLCNFKCRICGPDLSSSWYEDGKKLNPQFGGSKKPKIIRIDKDSNALWEQLEPHIDGLEFIQFAGGEPLIMEEHMQIMLKLDELKKYDVRITYNTNLSVNHFKSWNIFELWSRFNNVLIMASLDGMGAKGEYLRKGQNWKRTEELRREMLNTCPNVEFRLDPTVSVQNVMDIPDFYKDWYGKGLINANGMRLNFLFSPSYYSMKILRRKARKQVIEKYRSFVDDHLKNIEGIDDQTIGHFNAVIYHLKNDSLADKLKRLKNRLYFRFVTKRMDKIRDEHFDQIFPDVIELLNG